MARNEQLIRQHKVLQILERTRFGRTLEELRDSLVDELGLTSIHVRTLRRDIEALQAAGFDIQSEELQRGRIWKLGAQFRGSHTVTATASELMAVSLGRDLLFPLAGTPFWSGIESFWHKIREALPDSVWKHYEQYRRILHVLGTPAKSYSKHQGTLKTINRAILQNRVLEIDYQSLGSPKPTQRKIRPYAVVFYRSSLYIIGEAGNADAQDALRHWKLDRFHRAVALDEWFKPRSDVNISEYLRRSVGIFAGKNARKFRIRISPFAAQWIREEPWHPDQQIKEQKDGSVILTVSAVHDLEII
ncbi:MAG: transcriptional regulator, partial [Planctomycetales bacterium]|nr:transcriptional regulator [Planctomycetales bacterium]